MEQQNPLREGDICFKREKEALRGRGREGEGEGEGEEGELGGRMGEGEGERGGRCRNETERSFREGVWRGCFKRSFRGAEGYLITSCFASSLSRHTPAVLCVGSLYAIATAGHHSATRALQDGSWSLIPLLKPMNNLIICDDGVS